MRSSWRRLLHVARCVTVRVLARVEKARLARELWDSLGNPSAWSFISREKPAASNGPGALETPVGGGEFLDEGEFGGSFGLVFVDEGVDEPGEEDGGFAVDQDEAGEEAVGGVVAGGVVFAAFGDGAAGFGTVAAAGFALFF